MKISLPALVFALFSFGFFLLSTACTPQEYNKHGGPFGYRIDKPDAVYTLDSELREISGLAWLSEGRLVCIQDEKADLYTFDLQKGEVISKTDFGKNDDYEGVEIVEGEQIWVVKSDGDLYHFRYTEDKDVDAKKYETDLSTANDVEGLGYNPETKQLLLACKADPEHKHSKKYKGKAIYAFDIDKKELVEEPVLVIKDSDMATFLGEDPERHVDFNPSAIAWHPLEHRYYILSSVGKKIVVVDQKGEISHLIYLPSSLFRQPEGICFAPDGTMYISNEGKDGLGNMLLFKYWSPGKQDE